MLTVDFINVGYGDSILLRHGTPDGRCFTVLIDGGDSEESDFSQFPERIRCIDYLKQVGVSSLDLLIITHIHRDHVRGLLAVVSEIPVNEVWLNLDIPERLYGVEISGFQPGNYDACYTLKSLNTLSKILKMLKDRGTLIRHLKCTSDNEAESTAGPLYTHEGLVISPLFGKCPGYRRQDEIIAALYTESENRKELLTELDSSANSMSMVVSAVYNGVKLLFGADVDAAFWRGRKLPGCDIFKLPHHGRADSMTPETARLLSPRHVVISTTYDYPSLEALESFKACDRMPEFCCTDAVEIENISRSHKHKAVRFYITDDGTVNREFITDILE